jgi:hypothetical protein
MLTILENQNFVRLDRPFRFQLKRAHLHAFRQIVQPEPAGITARLSGSHPASGCQEFNHSFDVVITIRGLLSFARTHYAVRAEEHIYLRIIPFGQVHRQAQGIVWPFISIWGVVDDE